MCLRCVQCSKLEHLVWQGMVRQPRLALFGKVEHCCRCLPWLQVRMQEYNQVKGQLGQISRKQTGSLAVRDLSAVTQGRDFVNTENLETLFVVVSKHTKGDWLTNYEKLCEFVVSICGLCLGLPAALHDNPAATVGHSWSKQSLTGAPQTACLHAPCMRGLGCCRLSKLTCQLATYPSCGVLHGCCS